MTTSQPQPADAPVVGVEDVFPVRSRINWGPILGGAFVALALYFVLTLLGTAAGFTIVAKTSAPDTNAGRTTLAIIGSLWALFTTITALFVGGWVTSQLSVGETPKEAAVYGVILWGTVLAMLLFLLAAGVQAGFSGMVGLATLADKSGNGEWRNALTNAGYPRSKLDSIEDEIKKLMNKPKDGDDKDDTKQTTSTAAAASWWALAGTLLSMAASIGGAVVGAGPRFRLMLARMRRPGTVQM